MITHRRHRAAGDIALATVLAASLLVATPMAQAASGEPEPLAPNDEATLEIPGIGLPDSATEEGADGVGTRAEYEQAPKDAPVSSSAQNINDGSGFDLETRVARLIGITVDDEIIQRDGHGVEGIIIVSVVKNSPAARAGLRGEGTALQHVLKAGVVVCSVFFPPGFMALPFIEEHDVGKSYDLIIAVDGERVRDVLGLDDAVEKAQSGEIVYLSVIRGSRHLQIPVALPGAPHPIR
jgi:hypothetical protein